MYTIVTNNALARDRYQASSGNRRVEFLEDGGCLDVLKRVRDYIHRGCRLETHPMAGSVKPNQNPYKTVIISDQKVEPEEFQEFLAIIENGIAICRAFLEQRPLPDWPENLLADFRTVDLSLIESAADRLI